MDDRMKSAFRAAATALLLTVTAMWYLASYFKYPYYFIWDMDLATVLDALVIQSGLLPDHLNHPGFGMDLLLAGIVLPARLLGVVSAGNLAELAASLNPLACMAELTDFVRLVSPALCLLCVLSLFVSLKTFFKTPFFAGLLILAALGSQQSFIYHSTMNRTELYAVFFWCVSLVFFALAARSARKGPMAAWILLAGLMLGLSFMSKLQALFYVAAAPLYFVFAASFAEEGPVGGRFQADPKDKAPFFLGLFLALMFTAMLILADRAELPPGVWSFTPTWALAKYAVALALLLYCIAAVLGLGIAGKIRGRLLNYAHWAVILFTGFFLTYPLHFALYSKIGQSAEYLLANVKMVFFRESLYGFSNLSGNIGYMKGIIRYDPYPYFFHLLALAVLAWLAFGARRLDRKRFLACLGLSAFTMIGATLGCRLILRDLIWCEILVNFLSLLYCALAFSLIDGARETLTRAALYIGLALLVASNVSHSLNMTRRLDARYCRYGWNDSMWRKFVYYGNHQKYKAFIQERYGYDEKTVDAANGPEVRSASRHEAIRRTASFVFPGLDLTLRQTGVVSDNFPVFTDDVAWRIVELPEALRGKILVDPSGAGRRKGFLPQPPKPDFSESWPLEGFTSMRTPPALAVLPRSDLKVYVFTEKPFEDAAPKDGEDLAIAVKKGDERLVLHGTRIPYYAVIPLEKLGEHYFFVVDSSLVP